MGESATGFFHLKRRKLMLRVIVVFLGAFLSAGCATEAAKKTEPANPTDKPAFGRQSSSSTTSTSSRESTASSLDAHREGKPVTGGPLKEVLFEFDSYNLTSEARSILQANATWLKANPAVNVEIEGHCDERGTTEYNLALGAKRARAAMDYLVSLGIAPVRIKATSYGEELPVCKESTESCYQKNRRDRLVDVRPRPTS
jgi:peptidoglycan-associated lipoprotein